MEIMIIFLVLFPFLSALLLSMVKGQARKIVTYISSAAIIGVAVAFAVRFFMGKNHQLMFFSQSEYVDYAMMAAELFLMVLITVLGIKYKRYYVCVLSIVQSCLAFVYELGGYKPEQSIPSMYVDELTVIMVLIIAIVGTLITIYAVGYMKDYHNHHTEFKDRSKFFFAMLYVFLGAMFGLVLSNSLLWMYFFWEITSVVSFLLIGYTRTEEAITNSFRALWMNLLGGLGFAVAIVWAGVQFKVTDIQSLILCDGSIVIAPVTLLAFAALTKSAQLPFSRWLLGAMVAPTPSSALLHSATMVKAGVYLLIRLAPLMAGTYAGTMVSLVGGFTFLVTSMLAISVSDGKKVLAYSTISNLGLIAACAGVGVQETVWAAILLLIFHAVSKSLLFQTVGAIENTTGSREIESMHGLIARHPRLALTLSIGIAGMFLAPFGMLISKWAALKAFVDSDSIVLVLFICFGSATTLLYWTKWIATVLSWNRNDKREKNTTSGGQWFSLLVHSAMMVLLCFAFPMVSSSVVTPYLTGVYSDASEVLSGDNIIIMIIMLVLIFFIPLISLILLRRSRLSFEDTYLGGVNAGDQQTFYDSMGEPKRVQLSNWYLTDLFGEKRLWGPSVVISTAAIIILTVIAVGGAI